MINIVDDATNATNQLHGSNLPNKMKKSVLQTVQLLGSKEIDMGSKRPTMPFTCRASTVHIFIDSLSEMYDLPKAFFMEKKQMYS